ncbi:hypothetical protein [Brevundimonas sp.]|uniref:hypothetical protein n=1 Tax=Brevundimonas sp. TaxID=1871086 RepID=UPI002D3B6008|nr:hypothetical protein [Brevundimonas sp.]HYC99448.1 hypothetical protein [Brevundimonas sp.]
MMIVLLAGLLTPQAAPHPSTLEPYSAPAIRPFEPGPDSGHDVAQGDAAGAPHRPPLTAPVTVGAYDGSYELAPTDVEIAYDQGVASAEIRTDQIAGPLDGWWWVRDPAGPTLYELVLADSGLGPIEGGWRSGRDAGGAGVNDGVLTLDDGASIVLERTPAGWRGQMTRGGRVVPVTLTRPD